MAQSVIDLNCPGCGAPTSTGEKSCPFCQRPIVISTFNSVYNMDAPEINKYANAYRKSLGSHPDNSELNNSIGMCYLKLKLYDKAYSAFESAIENNFDSSETYFYAAISLMKGKKAFLATRDIIDKIEEYLIAATMIEPKGIYYYLHAYVKYDYHKRKYFNTSPNYTELLERAESVGLSQHDVSQLYAILGVDRPEAL
jgi:tetratricopeptide (TPR) repeat protein